MEYQDLRSTYCYALFLRECLPDLYALSEVDEDLLFELNHNLKELMSSLDTEILKLQNEKE